MPLTEEETINTINAQQGCAVLLFGLPFFLWLWLEGWKLCQDAWRDLHEEIL